MQIPKTKNEKKRKTEKMTNKCKKNIVAFNNTCCCFFVGDDDDE